ncbi:polyprenyl synthetase family protein [Streptococcus halichoeri]|uniref:polyprenyl synthetase family protein n=1 Tax=Streptococcus halichoeri TaxID=254785 RepID=UPI00135C2139|nr:farnesyl diphosphate synthase [Streptococcus halichoeri]
MINIELINEAIHRYYHNSASPVSPQLIESILYSVDSGGKRLRPRLFLELLEGFGLELTQAHYDLAAALEMIHTGSLIHDDLPAMDNDDYRRGRLTNHKQFDEATAILAGDSLFLDAFALIAQAGFQAELTVQLVALLSKASGTFGMVGGQMLDMQGEKRHLSLAELAQIHRNKTGQLLSYPFTAASILARQPLEIQNKMTQAGYLIGQAFQVRDDLLDLTASFSELGKTPKKDVQAAKATYPSLLGMEASYRILNQDLDQALAIFHTVAEETPFEMTKMTHLVEGLRLHG